MTPTTTDSEGGIDHSVGRIPNGREVGRVRADDDLPRGERPYPGRSGNGDAGIAAGAEGGTQGPVALKRSSEYRRLLLEYGSRASGRARRAVTGQCPAKEVPGTSPCRAQGSPLGRARARLWGKSAPPRAATDGGTSIVGVAARRVSRRRRSVYHRSGQQDDDPFRVCSRAPRRCARASVRWRHPGCRRPRRGRRA